MNKQMVLIAIILVILGMAGGYWLANRGPHGNESASAPLEQKKQQRTILFYRSAMNPSVTSSMPKKDAMGMDYVPVYAAADNETASTPPGLVTIDPVTVQDIGVRTAIAKRSTISHTIRAVGRVDFDEERLARLHPKTEGWIEKLRIDKTGEWVKKGTDLLSIYSPQLVSSQQEYLLALNNLKALERSPFKDIRQGAVELVKSSRERLKLLDAPEHQIRELEKSRSIKKSLHIHTPVTGTVMKIGVREGQYVTPATELYLIADLSRVWVYADIYEYELPWVRVGDRADMRLAAIPGSTYHGRVNYIYPYAEAKTRTIQVRLAFDNPLLLLKPELFADVTIYARRQVDAIVIPAAAVVRSGTRDQVFVVRAPGKFEPRPVILGLASSGEVQVLEGIQVGDEVVTSAQFLIDSESNLREATAKMMAPSKGVKTDKKPKAHPVPLSTQEGSTDG